MCAFFFHFQYLTFENQMTLIDTVDILQKQHENCYLDQADSSVFFAPDSYFCGKISLQHWQQHHHQYLNIHTETKRQRKIARLPSKD